jgi:hypothetical protein
MASGVHPCIPAPLRTKGLQVSERVAGSHTGPVSCGFRALIGFSTCDKPAEGQASMTPAQEGTTFILEHA